MNISVFELARKAGVCLTAVAALVLSLAVHAESPSKPISGARAMVLEIEAVVDEVDLEERLVHLRAPDGRIVTVVAREHVVKLEDVKPGDVLVVNYIAAIEGEVRAPTEAELAEPYVVLEEGGVSEDPSLPAVGAARAIRAVCTIEAIDKETMSLTIKDVNGRTLDIHDVEPEKLAAVKVGQQMVVIFREALALSLEHKEKS